MSAGKLRGKRTFQQDGGAEEAGRGVMGVCYTNLNVKTSSRFNQAHVILNALLFLHLFPTATCLVKVLISRLDHHPPISASST